MANALLDREFQYYLDHQDELVSKYNGRTLVIREQKVIGDFADLISAYDWAATEYELGTFIIQRCSPGPKDYTVVMHSQRVQFA